MLLKQIARHALSGLEHGGQRGEVLVFVLFGLSWPDSPVSRRVLAAAFCRAHDRERIARLQKCSHV
jgi:hypothetical protein